MPSTPNINLSSDFSRNAPAATDRVNASQLDGDHVAIETWANEKLLPSLAKVIRDDDTLVDGVVRARNLHPEILLRIGTQSGWQPKYDVQAASLVNINLSAPGATIDGRTMQGGDRFLVKNQTNTSQNGIYVWNGAGVTATRSTDADTATELGFAFVNVAMDSGTSQAATSWVCNQGINDIVLGDTGITFIQAGSNLISPAMRPVNSALDLETARAAMGPWDDVVYDVTGIVSVRSFGAVGDGTTNDKTAIENAIAFAVLNGKKIVYLPEGTYYKAGSGSGQGINIPSGIKIVSDCAATIKSQGYPVFICNENTVIDGLTFDNSSGGVLVGLDIIGDNVTVKDCIFNQGSQIIYTGAVDGLSVINNTFVGCGYQIIQKTSGPSNNCRVIGNKSLDCTSDFVELNASSECRNWLISDNYVANVGMSGATAVKTESRFFGAVSARNIVIANNIIESLAGDSAIHIEGTSQDIVVSNNIFYDVHGRYGSLVFFPPGAAVNGFLFDGNIVKFSSGYTALTNDGLLLIYSVGGDDSRLRVSNNTFVNASAVLLNLLQASSSDSLYFNNNSVFGFSTVLLTSLGGSSSSKEVVATFADNIIEDCTLGVRIQSSGAPGKEYGVKIEDNIFKNVTDVWTGSYETTVPLTLIGNEARETTAIDEAKAIASALYSISVHSNKVVSPATTTFQDWAEYTTPGVAKTIFTPPSGSRVGKSYTVTVHNGENSNNATMQLVRIDFVSPIVTTLTLLDTFNSGTTAPFTLSMSGNNLQFSAVANGSVRASVQGVSLPQHTQLV
jgi:hypothetical protein